MKFVRKLLFPPKCVGCGERMNIFSKNYNDSIIYCQECRDEWEYTKNEPCSRCKLLNIDCNCVPEALEGYRVMSLIKFGKNQSADRLIYSLKKHNNKKNFDFAVKELAWRLHLFIRENNIEVGDMIITNVPRKTSSVSVYGFDHAELIARGISDIIEVDYVKTLRRLRDGRDQKKLKAEKRLHNSRGKFGLLDDAINTINGKTIVIIDDVVTTGSTVSACIEELKKGVPAEIVILSIAKSMTKRKKNKDKKSKRRM